MEDWHWHNRKTSDFRSPAVGLLGVIKSLSLKAYDFLC